jgi:hypothetical protein
MVAPKLWTIAILVCALALTASVQAHQTLQWASFNRADQNSVQIKPVAQHHVLSTGGSVYSVFSHQDQATLHDVGLKFIKKVEIITKYYEDVELSNVQLAFKRTNPLAKVSLFVSFKIPLLSKSSPKSLPPVLRDAINRLLAPHFNSSNLSEIAKKWDKCSWVDSPSFFDNTVGLLCGWFDNRLPIPSLSPSRRDWSVLPGEEGHTTLVLEKLTLQKHEDSKTLWNYDPEKYAYNVTDKSHYSVWNVTSTVETWLTKGKYQLSSSSGPSALEISSVSVPLASKYLKSNIEHNLQQQGMHRELLITSRHKTIAPPTGTISCRDVVVEWLSDGWFVDQYEVEERSRFLGGPNVTIYRDIDLEKPSYLSPSNLVVVSKVNAWDASLSTMSLPVHLRYQLPALNRRYADVTLQKPLMVTYCAPQRAAPSVPDSSIVTSLLLGSYPSHLPSGHVIYIHQDVSDTNTPVITVQWPVGIWEQGKTVSNATLGITVIMAFITIKVILSKSKERQLELRSRMTAANPM